ncbi:MAG: zinc-ribbon domain-containing protein [Eubacterium sp.]|nr:zinc-ribbon domain-containing protein [Eubacterium sp.]
MYCIKCGREIPDEVYYCEHCGEAVNKPYTQQAFNSQDNNQQTYQQPNQHFPQYTPEAYEYMISSKLEEVRTFGIIAIIAGLFIPIIGIVLGCIGLSKINEIPLSNQYRFESELKRKKAKNLCIVGIVLPIALWILAIILFVFLSTVMFGYLSYMM